MTDKKTLGQVRFKKPSNRPSFEANNVIDLGSNFIVHSSGVSSPLFSPSSVTRRDTFSAEPSGFHDRPDMPVKDMNLHSSKPNANRDFTKELFNQLEKKIFSTATGTTTNENSSCRLRSEMNSSLSSIDNQTVTEAR